MKRLALIGAVLTLAATGDVLEAQGGGTGGRAIPQVLHFDASGDFVGAVELLIQAGWTNSPHSVDVTVTSVNGSGHGHGNQINALASVAIVDGSLEQGLARVVVPWTSDNEPRTVTDSAGPALDVSLHCS